MSLIDVLVVGGAGVAIGAAFSVPITRWWLRQRGGLEKRFPHAK